MTALEKIISEWELEYGVTNIKEIAYDEFDDITPWAIIYKSEITPDHFTDFKDLMAFMIADSNTDLNDHV